MRIAAIGAVGVAWMGVTGCSTGLFGPASSGGGPAAGAIETRAFRAGSARTNETIFSPLALPTPSTVRTAAGTPGPDYWQQKADYVIEAALEAGNVIRGRETVTYTNNSPEALDYIWIHLEQNLFKSDSLGALSTEPMSRFGHHGIEGGVDLKSVKIAGDGEGHGQELKVSVFDTLARVDLPKAIKPKGGTLKFECVWTFKVPEYGADRMGIEHCKDGDIFEIAQWFPAVAVYDDVYGWNTLPYLGQGEFYTNYGDFDVKLTVPHAHLVAATGVLQNPGDVLTEAQRERLGKARWTETPVTVVGEDEVGKKETRPAGDDPLTWHFKAAQVRTFAWAGSPAFLWDACFAKGTGPAPADNEPQGTLCMSMYPREAVPNWKEHSSDDLRWSIEHYSTKWHRYPYPVATNIHGRVGGMEYPMIIFCGARTDARGLFGVTTHEIGHNWFPMLINTDERRHAWMDEGFNSFINVYAGRERYPEEKPSGRSDVADYVKHSLEGEQQPMDTAADRIWRGRLGSLEYGKTAHMLVALREQVLGPERFDFAFRRYIDQWAFKSPRPADFFRCMEDASGMDLAWFWRGWVLESATLDQAVGGVRYTDDKRPLVSFENRGEMVMPVKYRVTYEDGKTEDRTLPVESWYSTNQWTTTWDAGGRRITRIEIDPEGKMPDTDRRNNVWTGK